MPKASKNYSEKVSVCVGGGGGGGGGRRKAATVADCRKQCFLLPLLGLKKLRSSLLSLEHLMYAKH